MDKYKLTILLQTILQFLWHLTTLGIQFSALFFAVFCKCPVPLPTHTQNDQFNSPTPREHLCTHKYSLIFNKNSFVTT